MSERERGERERGERDIEGAEGSEGERERTMSLGSCGRCRRSGKVVPSLSFPGWLLCARQSAGHFLGRISRTTPSSSCGFLLFKEEGLDVRTRD